MSKDNVLALRNPAIAGEVSDVLTQVLREGAQQMLARVIEAEVAEFLERYRLTQTFATQSQSGFAADLDGGHAGERTPGLQSIRTNLPAEIPEGG